MKTTGKKIVFISYSWKDRSTADLVRANIPDGFEVWIDHEQISPGDPISKKIQSGLTGSDYYVLLISESSLSSNWVQREIATAFDLANSKKLSVVPVLLQGADVPFEFKGLLYIDLRSSLSKGLQDIRDFFLKQATPVEELDSRQLLLKSASDPVRRRLLCNDALRKLSLGDLRYLVTERLSLDEVEVVWFDLFNRPMRDEIDARSIALSSVALIDRSRRMDVLFELMDVLCRNYPFINKAS
ncbi:hypothetical protein ACVWXP_001739 [Bradyrhizobium sp. USDA 4463]